MPFHRFISLRFRYVPSCPTSTVGNFTFAYNPDIRPSSNNLAGTTPATTTPSTLSKLTYSAQTVPWQACTLNVRQVPRAQSAYYCGTSQAITYVASSTTTVTQGALISPSLAESLHCFQGVFWGMSDVSTLATGIALGKIIMDYSADMFYRGTLPPGSGGDQLSLLDHSFGLTNLTLQDHDAIEHLLRRKAEQEAHPAITSTLNNSDPRASLCDLTWYNGSQVTSHGMPTNLASTGVIPADCSPNNSIGVNLLYVNSTALTTGVTNGRLPVSTIAG